MSNYKFVKCKEWEDSELLGDEVLVPKEWTVEKLNDLCDVRDGTHESPKFINSGVPFVTTKNLVNGKLDLTDIKYISVEDHVNFSRRSKVEEGDILLGLIGTIGNPVYLETKNFDFSIKNIGLIKTKNKLDNKYVFYYLKRLLNLVAHKSDGGVLKFMALTELRDLDIVNIPLKQQTAIASILTEQESVIQTTEQLIAKHEQRLRYLSNELLSGRLRVRETEGKLEFYKNTKWKTVEVNGEEEEIPEDWETCCLSKLVTIKGGISAPKKFKPLSSSSVPFYRVSNLGKKLKYLHTNDTNEFLNSGEYTEIPKHSVLIAKSGESIRKKYRSITKTASVIVGHIAALIPNDSCTSEYVYNLLSYFNPEDNLLKDSTMPSLSTEELSNFEVFFTNLYEQKLINNVLEDLNVNLDHLKKLNNLEKQRFQFLLDNLLSGKYLVETL